jgi:hypothetical protein
MSLLSFALESGLAHLHSLTTHRPQPALVLVLVLALAPLSPSHTLHSIHAPFSLCHASIPSPGP